MTRYVYRRCHIGQVITGDLYVGGRAHLKALPLDKLEQERQRVALAHSVTQRAFLRHPTVSWFGLAVAVQVAIMLATFVWERSLPLALFWVAWACAALLPALIWMTTARRALWDALQYLKQDLREVEAFIAVKRVQEQALADED
jgi:hypothetical protein